MSEDIKVVETTVIPEDIDVDVSMDLDQNQSWKDEARIREAELTHDLESQKLDFERERYYNSIPKSDKELELMYAYKNRLLDKRIADEAWKRSPQHRREQWSIGGAIVAGIILIGRWVWDMMNKGGN